MRQIFHPQLALRLTERRQYPPLMKLFTLPASPPRTAPSISISDLHVYARIARNPSLIGEANPPHLGAHYLIKNSYAAYYKTLSI
jgi:hypothetical protein